MQYIYYTIDGEFEEVWSCLRSDRSNVSQLLTCGVWLCNMSFLDTPIHDLLVIWSCAHLFSQLTWQSSSLDVPLFSEVCEDLIPGCGDGFNEIFTQLWGRSRLARGAQFTAPWPRSSRTNPAPHSTCVRHMGDGWLWSVNPSYSTPLLTVTCELSRISWTI